MRRARPGPPRLSREERLVFLFVLACIACALALLLYIVATDL
jgi:hypothetical protein